MNSNQSERASGSLCRTRDAGRLSNLGLRSVLGFCLILLVGCAPVPDGPARVRMSGRVSWNGKPVEKGMLQLVPVHSGIGDLSGATIRNGVYRVENKGGVLPGEYRVQIMAMRQVEKFQLPDGSESDVQQFIPKKFNDESEILLLISEQPAAFEKNFDLKD